MSVGSTSHGAVRPSAPLPHVSPMTPAQRAPGLTLDLNDLAPPVRLEAQPPRAAADTPDEDAVMQQLREARERLAALAGEPTPPDTSDALVPEEPVPVRVGSPSSGGPSVQQRRRMDSAAPLPPAELVLDIASVPHARYIDAERRRIQVAAAVPPTEAATDLPTAQVALDNATAQPSTDCSASRYGLAPLNAIEHGEWVWEAPQPPPPPIPSSTEDSVVHSLTSVPYTAERDWTWAISSRGKMEADSRGETVRPPLAHTDAPA